MKIRRHYIFKGDVQGVGFRYRAYYAARSYGVTGFVRNLYDGSVEMEAEGEEEMITKVILSIREGSFIWIEDMEVKEIPLKNEREFVRI